MQETFKVGDRVETFRKAADHTPRAERGTVAEVTAIGVYVRLDSSQTVERFSRKHVWTI